MLGHELRNPLAPIVTALHLLGRAEGLTEEANAARDMIDRQVHHLTRLVDDLLDVARITRGKVKLHRHAVELGPILSTAIETARPLLDARRHELTVSVPEEPIWLSRRPGPVDAGVRQPADQRGQVYGGRRGGDGERGIDERGPGHRPPRPRPRRRHPGGDAAAGLRPVHADRQRRGSSPGRAGDRPVAGQVAGRVARRVGRGPQRRPGQWQRVRRPPGRRSRPRSNR